MHHSLSPLLPRRMLSRFVPLFFVAVFALGTVALTPAPVFAETAQETLAKLLEQIKALQAQINTLQGQRTTTVKETPPAPPSDEDTPPVATYTFTRDLSFGLRNDPDVTNLQEFLIDQGFLQGSPSGNYFILTQKAVRKFQQAHNIKPSGYFGPLTRTVANKIMAGIETDGGGGSGGGTGGTGGGGSGGGPGGINNAPQINGFPAIPSNIQPGQAVSFSWHATDADNDDVSWSIDWGDGSGVKGACEVSLPSQSTAISRDIKKSVPEPASWSFVQSHTWSNSNAYTVKATVSDCKGGTNAHVFVVPVGQTTSANLPPVIYGLKAPTALRTGESGTWTIKASDPENGPLSYTVYWGDEDSKPAPPSIPLSSESVRQTSTFTHAYARAGTFTPVFSVYDNAGLSNQTSASVSVGSVNTNEPSITLFATANGQTSGDSLTIKTGDTVTISGMPMNLTSVPCSGGVEGKAQPCYSRAFFFDPVFNNVCGNNADTDRPWKLWCTPTSTGTSRVYVDIYQDGKTYKSNVITITVVASTIPPVKSMTLSAPNGGQQWQLNSLHTITWTPYDPNSGVNSAKDVTAYLERLVNGQYVVVGKIIEAGKASIHWIGEIDRYGNYPQPGFYYIRLVNNRTGESDRSDAPFQLVAQGTLKADMKLNNSGGPVTIPSGSGAYSVSWSSSADYCNISNGSLPVDSSGYYWQNLPSSGAKSIEMRQNTTGYSQYLVLSCVSRGAVEGSASEQIELLPSQAGVSVLAPNGTETVNWGEPQRIVWSNTAEVTKVSLALYKNDKWFAWITPSYAVSAGKNLYTWTPSQTITQTDIGGNVFKIYIIGYKTSGGTAEDKSDTPFSIVASSVSQPSITVLSPNGGEQYQAGQSTQMPLKWSASCAISAFTVELYKSGSFVQMINDNVPAGICSGSEQTIPYYTTWQIPSTLSAGSDYKVRVSRNASNNTGTVFDDSDASFSITAPAVPPKTAYDFKVGNVYLVVNGIQAESPGFRNPLANEDFQVRVTVENVSGSAYTTNDLSARLNIYDASGTRVYSVGTGVDTAALSRGPVDVIFKSDLFIPNISTATLRFPAGTYKAVADILAYSNDDPNPSNDSLTFGIIVGS